MDLDLSGARLGRLPSAFLWGASTSAHQTEGGNTESNWWHLETAPDSPLTQASGDAVDSYHRYPEDMQLLADSGLTAYRFSIEWARIEPHPGQHEMDQLAHYRRMIETCTSLGMTPVVTLHHFTNPWWFTERGGWRQPGAIEAFTSYVETVSSIVEDVPWVCTINEPNMVALAANLFSTAQASSPSRGLDERSISAFALDVPADDVARILGEAHGSATQVLRQRTDARIGWTVSNQAFEAETGCEDILAEVQWAWEDRFLELSRSDDFVGVQSYTVQRVGPAGPVPHSPGPDSTQTGWPNRPDALATAIRHTWQVTGGTPVLVTENGIATADDEVRTEYTGRALSGLLDAVDEGVDVRGYLHWSALDNYEWGDWDPTFGLIAVDRTTFERTPRPSLAWLGSLARAHAETSAQALSSADSPR